MKQYLNALQTVLDNSHDIRNNRTGIPDVGIGYGVVFIHDMSNGFPLITTKKMGLKNIATELEFFIKGYTDKKWLQDRNCHIWDEWANPIKVTEKYNIESAKINPNTITEQTAL
ncbi:MAG: thymidylate synthase, partial [Alphaproteobacteria bacterium]